MKNNQPNQPEEDKPPFFKKWSSLYWVVVINLIIMIGVCYLITNRFA